MPIMVTGGNGLIGSRIVRKLIERGEDVVCFDTAPVYRGPDGSLLLRLENFTVTNGPDLHVYVTPHENPGNSNEVKTDGYLDLGELKGNVGNQNYFLPDDFDVRLLGAVVIYCQPFNINFAVAPLTNS